MNKEFVPYEIALGLKQIGFDEDCVGSYFNPNIQSIKYITTWRRNSTLNMGDDSCTAPTFSQAFRWFREKKVLGLVNPIDDWNSWSYSILAEDLMSPFYEMKHGDEYKSYEESELACLAKMIELHQDKDHE